MSDLNLKYQRLAAEYGKLKAQNQVLKKAVVEQKENLTQLTDQLNQKDQTVRRSQQEIESSHFRNQQMTRRIQVLQEEIETKQQHNNNNTRRLQSGGDTSAVDDDLRLKISENERLHKQVYESEVKTRQIEQQLNDQLQRVKKDLNQLQMRNEELTSEQQQLLDKSREDKAFLETKLLESESSAAEFRSLNARRLSDANHRNTTLTESLNTLQNVVSDAVVFNDMEEPSFTRFKVFNNDKRFQVRYKQVMESMCGYLSELCDGLKNFHTHSRQRSLLYPIDCTLQQLPDVTQQLALCHQQAPQLLDDVITAFNSVFTSIEYNVIVRQSAPVLTLATHRYVALLSKLKSYQFAFLQAECDSSLCVPNLQSKNADYFAHYQRFFPAFAKLFTYVELLLQDASNSKGLMKKISATFNELHLLFKDLSKTLNGKIALESQLPTTTQDPKLRTANEFLLATMLQLSTASGKISGALQEHEDFLAAEVAPLADVEPALADMHRKTVGYLQQVNTYTAPPSVGYEEALQLRSVSVNARDSDVSSDDLKDEVRRLKRRIGELEQEKEHWLLETQLLQMKLDKHATTTTTSVAPPSVVDAVATGGRVRTNSSCPTDVSTLGTLKMSNDGGDVIAIESTEQLIKQHMSQRLNEAAKRTQLIESKAEHFQLECGRLQKHLRVTTKQISEMEGLMGDSSQQVSSLRDELALTRKNYEQQLNLMTEHLAAMNERLAAQQEEIETLKIKKKSKVFGN